MAMGNSATGEVALMGRTRGPGVKQEVLFEALEGS